MKILGLNINHADSSAALVIDGRLYAACEEERFSRVKHTGAFPTQAISWCLQSEGLSLQDIDLISIGYNSKANLLPKALYSLKNLVAPQVLLNRIQKKSGTRNLIHTLSESLQDSLAPHCTIEHVEHHFAHLATAYYLSPFESCALLSVDGMGDFASCMLGIGKDNRIQAEYAAHFPNSLGYLYTAITVLLGYPHFGDEYKVMGLAPYGTPRYLEQFKKLISIENNKIALNHDFFNISLNTFWCIDDDIPKVSACHNKRLEELLEFSPAKLQDQTGYAADVAASLQARTEEIIFELLDILYKKHPHEYVGIAGGVAMNSVAIGKVSSQSSFQEVFVPPGAADNGVSIGAALYSYYSRKPDQAHQAITHAYLGPAYDNETIAAALADAGLQAQSFDKDADCIERTVELILEGKVIGWFQGRMEFGARALGNRSILADPRDAEMKARINAKIKNREPFRPFAPSILEEHVKEYFEPHEMAPFMERVLTIKEDKRSLIPAVTHVDGTGRLQSVSRETNEKYWELIHAFYKESGVPILLNTSFNQQEPVVCTPSEAINCFLRSDLDALVIGNSIVVKE